MSLTKSSPAYERWAEEQREDLEHSHTEYMESLYLRGRTRKPQRFPADDEQPETKPAERHNTMNNGTRII